MERAAGSGLYALTVMHIEEARAVDYAGKAAFVLIESCCRLTRERDEARSTMESAVAAARAAGPVPNGAAAMEEDAEPPAKRVSLLCHLLWLLYDWQLLMSSAASLLGRLLSL